MDAVIGTNTNNIVAMIFNKLARMKYEVEKFFTFDPSLSNIIPFGEMLARDPDNFSSNGYLFDEARKYGQTVPADLEALEVALKQHLVSGQSSSINLNAETYFSPNLHSKLDQLKSRNPELDPTRLWLEITEQGGVPKNTNIAALQSLKNRGYRLAIDDFGLDNPEESVRLDVFGPHVSGVKLDHTYAEKFRDASTKEQERLGQKIHAIQDRFPGMIFIQEGVKGTDTSLFPILHKAGIRVVQQSGWVNDGPTKPIDPREIALALNH